MSLFRSGDVLLTDDRFLVASEPDLPDDRRLMALETVDGTVSGSTLPYPFAAVCRA